MSEAKVIKLKLFYDNTMMTVPLTYTPLNAGRRTPAMSNLRLYTDKKYKVRTDVSSAKLDKFYINDTPIEARQLWSNDPQGYFKDCFGAVVITVFCGKKMYVSDRIPILTPEAAWEESVVNMMRYVGAHAGEGLLGKHGLPEGDSRRKTPGSISIDEKLALASRTADAMTDCLGAVAAARPSKAAMNEGGAGLTPAGLRYMATHPECLVPVSYSTGIAVGGSFYAPARLETYRAASTARSYEELAVTGFLLAVIEELEQMRSQLTGLNLLLPKGSADKGYVMTAYHVYSGMRSITERYVQVVDDAIARLREVYDAYAAFLPVPGFPITGMPMFTPVFSKPPYSEVYAIMSEWFSSGACDVTRSQLYTDFVTVSRIYELFCLVKLLRSLESVGFRLEKSYRFKYDISGFYYETSCNNTFVFKGPEGFSATVYYQPVIQDKKGGASSQNGIGLLRSTSRSLEAGDMSISSRYFGRYYTPDFMLKLTYGQKDYYFIFDAKHSTKSDVMYHQLHSLIFKYLFSVRGVNRKSIPGGLCVICGRERVNGADDLHDLASSQGIYPFPMTHVVSLGGLYYEDDATLDNLIENYMRRISNKC